MAYVRLRRYRAEDLDSVLKLFYHTVHNINSKDYTPEQLNVWAPPIESLSHVVRSNWKDSLRKHYTLIAIRMEGDPPAELINKNANNNILSSPLPNEQIVGFGDITAGDQPKTAYLDHLFVHANYQGQCIGSALLTALESYMRNEHEAEIVSTHSSITARPFFLSQGYRVLRSNVVERNGLKLNNFVMLKDLAI